jgi:hypothetical protein
MNERRAFSDSPAAGPLPPRRQRFVGRCDCGCVRYEVELSLNERDPHSRSVWERSVPPPCFLLQRGHDSLIGYQFADEDAHHFFCTCCQARAFSHCAPEQHAGYYTVDLKALAPSEPTPQSAPPSV